MSAEAVRRFAPMTGLLGLYIVLVQVHRASGGVLATHFADQRALTPTQIGAVVATMYLASAAAQLPMGLAFDRFGARLTLSGSGFVAVGGIAWFALAQSPEALIASRFVIGVGQAGVVAGLYVLASAWVAPSRLATATATVLALAGGLGALIATTPLEVALATVGLRVSFLAIALGSLACCAAILVLVQDRPPHASGAPPRRTESLRESLAGLAAVARDRELWPIFAMGSCFTAPFFAVGGLWAGPYLRDVQGLDPIETSYVLLAMMMALYAGTLGYGPLDRVFRSRKRVVLGGSVVMVAMLSLLVAFPGAPLAVVVALLVVFSFASPFFPTLAAHCRGFVPLARAGRAIACLNLVGLTTAFALQLGIGVLIEATAADSGRGSVAGFRLAFGAVAVILVAASAAYLRVRDIPPGVDPPR